MKLHSQFFDDCKSAISLCNRHKTALGVSIIATMMLVIMKTPSLLYEFGPHHINAFIYYGFIPFCSLVVFSKFKFKHLGIGLGDYKFWLPASALYLLIAIPITLASSQNADMNTYYQDATHNWGDYILTTAIYMLGWEYLYRGYLIFGLKASLKEGAIIVQMIPFVLLHLGKPDIEIISCIFSGLIWGYICYRGNSFWPAVIMHLAVNFTIKAYTN